MAVREVDCIAAMAEKCGLGSAELEKGTVRIHYGGHSAEMTGEVRA